MKHLPYLGNQPPSEIGSQFGPSPGLKLATSLPAMGNCPSRAPQQPPVVVNVQSVPAAEPLAPVVNVQNVEAAEPVPPAPPPPQPVPELNRRRWRIAQRREALLWLFQQKLLKCPQGKKIHIVGFCSSAREPTPQMPEIPWCKHCAQAFIAADATSSARELDA